MPLAGAVGALGGCQPAKAAVRTHGVVIRPPCLDDPSRCSKRREQVLVQALVAQATIERFHKTILLWLSGCDVMPLDARVLTPGQNSVTGQFGASLRIDPPDQSVTVGVAD